jgi:hypothetical protein
MSGTEGNKGVVISGGTVSGSNIVAGHHNTVNQTTGTAAGDALGQARADAQRLVEALASGGYSFEELPSAHANAIALADELNEETPDVGRLKKWLGRLTGLVARVAPLAEIVVAVEESVRLLAGG